MASKSNIVINIQQLVQGGEDVKGAALGLNDVAKAAENLQAKLGGLNTGALNFAAISTAVSNAQQSIQGLQSALNDLSNAYAVQEQAERQLETVMRQRMGATAADIQSIKDLCAAQQELGVIGDEVQLAGAQQLATFVSEKETLEALIPVMNNLVAQQAGLNATQSDCESVAKLMGKAMEGNVNAFKRMGIEFTDTQKTILEYGTEAQKASVLTDVITARVGNMNAELAKTDSGKMKQLSNTLGDVKEKMGQVVNSVMPYVTLAAQLTTASAGVVKLVAGVKACTAAMQTLKMSIGAVGIAFGAISVGVALFKNFTSEANRAETAARALNKTISETRLQAQINVANIQAEVDALRGLYEKTQNVTESMKNRIAAVDELKRKYPDYFADISNEDILVGKAKDKYDDLTKSIINSAKARAYSARIAELQEQILINKAAYDQEARPWLEKKLAAMGPTIDGKVKDPGTLAVAERSLKILDTQYLEPNRQLQQQIDALASEAASLDFMPLDNPFGPFLPKIPEPITPTGAKKTEWHEDARNIKELSDNLSILQERLSLEPTIDGAAKINRAIEEVERKIEELRNAGREKKPLEILAPDFEEIKSRDLKSLADYDKALQDLSTIYANTTDQSLLPAIREQIELLGKQRKAFENLPQAFVKPSVVDANAYTLKGIRENIDILREELATASMARAVQINSEIDNWERLAEAIENAGKKGESTGDKLRKGWGGLQSVQSSFEDFNKVLSADSTLWDRLSYSIEGFVKMVDGITAVIDVIKSLSAITGSSAAAEVAAHEATAQAATADANAQITDAAAKALNAHAWIPWVGAALGAVAVGAMIASMLSVPKFAEGGIAYGPTLGLFGEYAGAGSNPEVVAPLDKLRTLIEPQGGRTGGEVRFEIEGRTLVGVLEKQQRHENRR